MKVIDVKEKKKENSQYVNYAIEWIEPYEKNGSVYEKVNSCQVSSSVVNGLIQKGFIKTADELIGKTVFIGKKAGYRLTETESKYGFYNCDTIIILGK